MTTPRRTQAQETTDLIARLLEEARRDGELAGMTILPMDVVGTVDGVDYTVPAGAMAVGVDDAIDVDAVEVHPGEEWRDIHADACRGITRHMLGRGRP